MHAFYGQDLHWKKQYRGLRVALDCDSLQRDDILNTLATGAYSGEKDDLQLPSSGVLPESLLVEFGNAQMRSQNMWRFLKNGKQALDRFGIRVPESLKAQLRRIF
jgi:hypothetical protein